ncbi:MAG: hypothetical protein LC772_05165, partial [Chloroflexi bacterium]|nr:hypothetical protein [Chloroflexota bacterium]
MIDLGGIGARSSSEAQSISNRTHIVGDVFTFDQKRGPGAARAALFSRRSAAALNTPGRDTSRAAGINDSDMIVGTLQDPAGRAHAVAWKNGKVFTLGGNLKLSSYADAVNRQGDVTGQVLT